MSQGAGAIDGLRREIDAIDTAMHDLLIRRSEITAEIGRVKAAMPGGGNGGDALLRPGREAVILRRLVERHRGPLPWGTIVRIWRELMSAALRTQGPLAVAVYGAKGTAGGYWDLARDHFGTHTPMAVRETAPEVLRAVADGSVTVGILPMPQEDEREPWWPQLIGADPAMPRIFARLPFGAPGVARRHSAGMLAVEALAVGRVAPEATGDDRSLFALELAPRAQRDAGRDALQAAGFAVTAMWAARPQANRALQLVEVAGCVAPEDERWRSALFDGAMLRQVWPLGAYAVPLHAAAPAEAPAQAAAAVLATRQSRAS
jgi:chorismate mutase-like protein